uniref:Uncharacterized protein n=1 Tax=Alexandrium andersonii TaxID=327968 RepID=A0A7S2D7A3_9DINO|mmetsp:Transcript_48549/g.109968  ORF Transcript_48549/g.109968 Transcript_48549/m.109968 type:complete len:117 (+) Transcript_48549:104-454(+)
MPYQRGDRIMEPAGRRGGHQVSQQPQGKSAVDEHFAKASALEPEAMAKVKAGELSEALGLLSQMKKELDEAAYAAGPGSPNQGWISEAATLVEGNINFCNSYLPYEMLLEPSSKKK